MARGNMSAAARACVMEALRRYQAHHAGESPLSAWTGLGYPSVYRAAVAEGYMVPVRSQTPRVLGWYRLTERGVAAMLGVMNEGYVVRDYEVVKSTVNGEGGGT